MTTPKTYEMVRHEMVRDLGTYYGLLVVASIYGLLLADSGQLPKAKEQIQALLEDPDYLDQMKGNFSEVVLTEEELLMILEEWMPKIMHAVHEGIEEEQEKGEKALSPAERGISRLLLGTDFAR